MENIWTLHRCCLIENPLEKLLRKTSAVVVAAVFVVEVVADEIPSNFLRITCDCRYSIWAVEVDYDAEAVHDIAVAVDGVVDLV